MASRRFMIYFLVASALTLAATVLFEIYAFERAISHSMRHEMMFARSVARYVRGALDQDAARLREVAALALKTPDAKTLRHELEGVQGSLFRRGEVLVFDARLDLTGTSQAALGLPPPTVLLPALRAAREADGVQVTDLWRDRDGRPCASLVVSLTDEGDWRAAVALLRLDGEEFLRAFDFFVVNPQSRLQLLDSTGITLFSTSEDERYQSVVHGTYLTDRVRIGEPAQMPCHSCHTPNGLPTTDARHAEVVREDEYVTVVPITGTGWSITVRERKDVVYAPMREMILASIVLVSVIFGTFLGFFLVLARRVLKPMRQLAEAATTIARSHGEATVPIDAQDELGLLAQSFEAMRKLMRQASESAEPRLALDLEAVRAELRAVEEASGPLAVDDALGEIKPSASAFRDVLEHTLDTVFANLVRVELVSSALIVLDGGSLEQPLVVSRGLSLAPDADLGEKLLSLGAEVIEQRRGVLDLTAAERAGIVFFARPPSRAFFVQPFDLLESVHGQLWMGVAAAGDEFAGHLALALVLIGTQAQSLVERGLLHDQLRIEHRRKSQMLHHLFDAESEERKRIAREIHDETAQMLAALLLVFETFPGPEDPQGQQRTLGVAKERVAQILDATDRLIRRLRPAVLDDLGLVEAMRTVAQNLLVSSGLQFEMTTDGEDVPLPKGVENALYRVFQEASANVVRHSGARRVCVDVNINEERAEVTFKDNGHGVDLSWMDDPNARPRWGMLGMRERILQIGGTIAFSTPEGGGLMIAVHVPLGGKVYADPFADEDETEDDEDASTEATADDDALAADDEPGGDDAAGTNRIGG